MCSARYRLKVRVQGTATHPAAGSPSWWARVGFLSGVVDILGVAAKDRGGGVGLRLVLRGSAPAGSLVGTKGNLPSRSVLFIFGPVHVLRCWRASADEEACDDQAG